MFKRNFTPLALTLFVLAWGVIDANPLHAQNTTGTIVGTVTDPSGAAVPKANVTITNKGTNDTRLAVSSATGEYQQALGKGRITKPVEYQDSRGFVWQAEKMVESLSAALEKKDADALKHVRGGFAELKKAWPAAMPPKTPAKDYAAVLSDVSRIELSIGKLM